MKVKDWLLELAENNRIEVVDGKIKILPIKEDDMDVDFEES